MKFLQWFRTDSTTENTEIEYVDFDEAVLAMQHFFTYNKNAVYLEIAKYGNGKVGITIKDKHRRLIVKLKSMLPG